VTGYLDRWLAAGYITTEQHQTLLALVRRERISVFVELNALLYLGVLSFVGGLAWTAQTYSSQWGDAAILLPATACLAGCFYYCFSRSGPFSRDEVPRQGFVFDYVLYLGCLIFGVELGYIEYRFNLLQTQWDYYLLASAVLYFALAYRFDNRFVLSLGIATLGGWFGIRLAHSGVFIADSIRASGLVFGIIVALLGLALHAAAIKRHFLETYMHVAANVTLAAVVSGVVDSEAVSLWFAALVLVAGGTIAAGVLLRRFAFVVYGTVYGYVGISRELIRHLRGDISVLSYFVVSAGAVIVGLVVLSRSFGRDE
jgi:hypothetical protein